MKGLTKLSAFLRMSPKGHGNKASHSRNPKPPTTFCAKARASSLTAQRTSKTRVTMFLDQDVIEAFKQAAAVENALPYQTQINLALRRYLAGQTLSLSLSDTATIQTLARAIAQELQAAQPKRK